MKLLGAVAFVCYFDVQICVTSHVIDLCAVLYSCLLLCIIWVLSAVCSCCPADRIYITRCLCLPTPPVPSHLPISFVFSFPMYSLYSSDLGVPLPK